MNLNLTKHILNTQAAHKLIIVLTLLFFQAGFSQISVSGTPVSQTCPGNGSITFAVQNANTSYPVTFRLFLLPDTVNPVSENSNTMVQGLSAGTYIVIASQTINGNTVTGTSSQIIIENLYIAPDFTLASINSQCGSDGSITATQTTGTITTYELTGPVNRPQQASPVFNNLPAGVYTVKAKDACGTVIPHTITLFSNVPALSIAPPGFPDVQLPGCNLITISNNVTPVTNIPLSYPFNVVIKVYPPQGGAPLLYNQVITSGEAQSFTVMQVVPFYYDTDYYYDITITDPCGTQYAALNNLIRQKLTITAEIKDAGCGFKFIILAPSKFVGPFTINFTSPSGFNPTLFNSNHPGPFTGITAQYGEYEDGVPFGIYNFTVADACGRTASGSTELIYIEPVPVISVSNSNCTDNLGQGTISINGYIIETAQITASTAPGFTNPLPYDVSSFIKPNGRLEVTGLPPGTYTFTVTDTCGNIYDDLIVIIPDFSSSVNALARPGCEPGTTSVSVSGNSPVTEIFITAVPPEFDQVAMPLPYNVSENINGGVFYMEGLPPGAYSFSVINECGATITANATLIPYATTTNTLDITRHCGSFDVSFNHASNATAFLSYWLQKETSPGSGIWGHPYTGQVYQEGSLPNIDNSLSMTVNTTIYSITQLGEYRIIKRFRSFSNTGVKDCIEILHEFEFNDDLVINGINTSCPSETYDVEVIATGAEPLSYTIKNIAETFFHDNGTSNLFLDLPPDSYTVSVTDPCGRAVTRFINIVELPSIINITAPTPLYTCDDGNDSTDVFTLTDRNSEVLGSQDPAIYQVTYHITEDDAEAGINALPAQFTSPPATVYARVQFNDNINCYKTAPLELRLYESPRLNLAEVAFVCQGALVTLQAGAGFSSYKWSTGAETPSITTTQPGIYTVTVTNATGCKTVGAITVIPSVKPEIDRVISTDWTDNSNTITVITTESSFTDNFEYSIDGINYQDSNTFTNLAPGIYTVYVKDKHDCGRVQQEVYLLNYPKFFTPNNDGVNDFWQISNSLLEKGMLIYIYDRYGKLITGFTPESRGWDGNLNGARLPATDYWFVVQRPDGRVHKGHFAMIR